MCDFSMLIQGCLLSPGHLQKLHKPTKTFNLLPRSITFFSLKGLFFPLAISPVTLGVGSWLTLENLEGSLCSWAWWGPCWAKQGPTDVGFLFPKVTSHLLIRRYIPNWIKVYTNTKHIAAGWVRGCCWLKDSVLGFCLIINLANICK